MSKIMDTGICYEMVLKNHSHSEILDKFDLIEDIDQLDSQGETLLLAASALKQKDNIAYFLSRGANPNYMDDCGDTPLLCIIDTVMDDEDTSIELAELLLNSGADIEQRGYMDKTPFLKACSRKSLRMIKLLVSQGCNTNAVVQEYEQKYNAIYFAKVALLGKESKEYIKSVCNS